MRERVHVIVEIIRKEFHQIRQDKRMMVISILAPLIQVVLLGYAATTDIRSVNMVVYDMDKTPVSREFIQRFTTSGYFIEMYHAGRESDIEHYIEQGEALIALTVPEGFGADITDGRPAQVQVILDGSDASTANTLLGYANQIVSQYSQFVRPDVSMMLKSAGIGRVLPEPRVWFNPDLVSSNYMVPGVIALVLMIITTTLTSLGIVREKEVGTLEQLMVTPIKPYQLILGKLLPFTVIGFVDVLIVLAIARYWFNVPLLGSLWLLFALSVLFILNTLGLGLFVSTIAKSQQQAMLIAQFFIFMPMIFVSGFAFPIANMPEVIQYFTYLVPLRYFLEIVRGIFLKGLGLHELWSQALALLAFGTAILALSVLRFRKKLE